MTTLLQERITAYLSGGGLFNPEMAIHTAVRDLLIDCRAALAAEQPQAATADDMKVYEAECRKTCNVCWSGDSDGQWPCAKSKASPQANQPQAGWKLVPIEPTPEMLFAGHMKIDFDRSEQNTYEMSHESQRGPEGVGTTIEQDMRDCWSAMIAAAPQANQPQEVK